MRRFVALVIFLAACGGGDWDGYTVNEGDCNDNAPDINPHALEECGNAIDDNCDGQIDEGCDVGSTPTPDTDPHTDDTDDCPTMTWYEDRDGDDFGGDESIEVCEDEDPPADHVRNSDDCDDDDRSVHPDAPEKCDGKDNDCDGGVDENLSDAWYFDSDGDGYGSGSPIDVVCNGGHGELVDNDNDCDDDDNDINPNADEVCDRKDNDCDYEIDVDAIDALAWFADDDQDGYGNRAEILVACERPAGFVEDSTDCDDDSNETFPGAPEACDGKDNDCDNRVPGNELDNDGDRYVECGGDCNDENAQQFPGNPEVCDGLNNDCSDGVPRDELDNDGDGYVECSDVDPDCDDTDRRVHPGTIWNMDGDEDGYGRPGTDREQCEDPSNEDLHWIVDDERDCDDGDNDIHPGAPEECDREDNDCDSYIDEGVC